MSTESDKPGDPFEQTLVDVADLMRLLKIKSRTTVDAMIKRGDLPPPLHPGNRVRRWDKAALTMPSLIERELAKKGGRP